MPPFTSMAAAAVRGRALSLAAAATWLDDHADAARRGHFFSGS